jgi:predicted aspartyl protease
MIIGRVNAHREALIPLNVQDANGHGRALDAIIDTGFTGSLTLPPALIVTLGLTWRGYASAILGDGSLQQFEVYAATVLWDGQARVVEIDAADTRKAALGSSPLRRVSSQIRSALRHFPPTRNCSAATKDSLVSGCVSSSIDNSLFLLAKRMEILKFDDAQVVLYPVPFQLL